MFLLIPINSQNDMPFTILLLRLCLWIGLYLATCITVNIFRPANFSKSRKGIVIFIIFILLILLCNFLTPQNLFTWAVTICILINLQVCSVGLNLIEFWSWFLSECEDEALFFVMMSLEWGYNSCCFWWRYCLELHLGFNYIPEN